VHQFWRLDDGVPILRWLLVGRSPHQPVLRILRRDQRSHSTLSAFQTIVHIHLLANSSSSDPYSVAFEVTPQGITAVCTCQAGMNRQLCKHLRAFISGDARMLFDPSQAPALQEVTRWCQAAGIPALFDEMDRELEKIAVAKKELDRQVGEIKRRLVLSLHAGVAMVDIEDEPLPIAGG
jgi:hypothetical protein